MVAWTTKLEIVTLGGCGDLEGARMCHAKAMRKIWDDLAVSVGSFSLFVAESRPKTPKLFNHRVIDKALWDSVVFLERRASDGNIYLRLRIS